MDIKITPKPLSGTVDIIPSKSHAHRLLIASAIADIQEGERRSRRAGEERAPAAGDSADMAATKNCIAALFDEDLGSIPSFDCGESGSTLRFLLPVAAALKEETMFYGSGRLPDRPLSPLREEMEAHGCRIEFAPERQVGTTGAKVNGREKNHVDVKSRLICKAVGRLKSGEYTLSGKVSSQFITGLLLALPILEGDSHIALTTELESEGYVDLTLAVLADFGIAVTSVKEKSGYLSFHVAGKQTYYRPVSISAEGDWSNGAFWLTADLLSRRLKQRRTYSELYSGEEEQAKAICESEPFYGVGAASVKDSCVRCRGLDENSVQGDKAIVSLLALFEKANENSSREIDAGAIPDLVPILSVAAAVTPGTTKIFNAERLRIKESDRLKSMTECLSTIGADIEEQPEGLVIRGKPILTGGSVKGHNDHRVVMSMAIASICCRNPVTIKGAEAADKSYPSFFTEFQRLGGEVNVS